VGRRADPFAIQPVDTVGAGDAFVGALATRMAQQRAAGMEDEIGLMDAVCWAKAAGALACLRPGAIPSLPTRADVVAFLRQAGHMSAGDQS
jgi:sugar/nucleoside kinase (ribokinase family)